MRLAVGIVAVLGLLGCRIHFDEVGAAETCEPAVDVTALSAGGGFACGLLAGGEVRCWGAGETGQLGDGAMATRLEPVSPSGLPPATMVSAGVQHACALAGGAVWCWGRNDTGQLGLGDRAVRTVPTLVPGLPSDVIGVAAGGLNTCAWTQAGQLYCWGQDNGVLSSTSPVRVTGVPPVAKASLGSRSLLFSATHSCAIGVDGTTWCWGSNRFGELGEDPTAITETLTPVQVVTSLAFVDIDLGLGHTCGRTSDGVVACWGLGVDGELGTGAVDNRFVPTVVAVPPSVEISVNAEISCSRDRDGGVTCWGDNDEGQLGRTGPDGLVPEVMSMPPARGISAGGTHACAIDVSGVVRCWGSDRAGLRSGVLDTRAVTVGVDATALAAGGDVSCSLGRDGRVRCWGDNTFGELGDGTRTSRATPTDVGLASVTSLDVGVEHVCATLGSGSVACWGSNEDGRVLPTADADYTTPQMITGVGISATHVAAGGAHTCAVGDSGAPWCWGNSDEGTSGRGASASPAPRVSGFTNVASIAAGSSHTCIVTTTNQLFCAGRDNEGQIGRSDNVGDVYAPLEVTLAPSVRMVSAGRLHTCAVSTSGTGWCWGSNVTSQLGDATPGTAQEPRALPLTGLVEVAAGFGHSCARDAAGTVWCWGANTSGQLGDRTLETRTAPVLATELAGAVELAAGSSHTCARMADGSVRCVGARESGQTGSAVVGPEPLPAVLTCPRR